MNEYQLTRGLAVFSVGLGLAELLAPRRVARCVGLDPDKHETWLRLCGLRELGSGLGLMQGRSDYFLWSRVAGDAMDLALLGAAWRSEDSNRARLQGAIAAVASLTVLDVIAATLRSRNFADPHWRDPRPMGDRSGFEPGALPSAHFALSSERDGPRGSVRDDVTAGTAATTPMPEPGAGATPAAATPDQATASR